MDTHLLKNFLVLAKTKNFTKAAEKLFCSQSALSLQIGRLEALLNKPLFVRDKRKVALTLAGEELMGYAEKLLKLEEEMVTHFKKPILTGEVSFGTPEDLATVYLPQILATFVKTHPGIFLNVYCEFSLDLLKGFDSRRYDLVLVKQDPDQPHPRSQVVWSESLVWVGQKTESPLPLVLAPSPCVYRQRAIDALNRAGIVWRMVYTSPSLTGTLAAVKAGLGVSVLPLNMVPKDLQIIRHLPPLKDAQITLLNQEKSSDAAKALADYVGDHIKSF